MKNVVNVPIGKYVDFLVIEIDGIKTEIESIEYIKPVLKHKCLIKVNDDKVCLISEDTFDLIEEDMGK